MAGIIIIFGLFQFEKMCCTMCLIIFIFEVDKILVKVHNFKCMSVLWEVPQFDIFTGNCY